jgi:putative ABC transport system ATP-binding protein
METILETKNLSKIYESGSLKVKAVDEITLQFAKGEFVALVGPSGSGKTTMLALLAGLLRPTAGTILVENTDLVKMSDVERTRFRRQKVGFTFQANNLVPYLTALENVELMLRMNKQYDRKSADKAKNLLVRLGLGDRLNNLPSQLSGGQQQRVAIARALIHDPTLVLADEPTAALDTERATQVVQILSQLIHEQGRTGIMVTHDLRMCQFADRVIQMMDGKIARILENREEINELVSLGNQQNNPNGRSTVKSPAESPNQSLPIMLPSFQAIGD